jgi:transposase-like protein
VKINGVKHDLWRAVDHEGEVLARFVTKRRDKKPALKSLRKSLRRHGAVETIVTDRLASCGAKLKAIGAIGKRHVGRWLNNRAENSRQPFRRRERAMLRFRRMCSLQAFAALHGSLHNQFRGPSGQSGPRPHLPHNFQGTAHCCSQRVAPNLRGLTMPGWGDFRDLFGLSDSTFSATSGPFRRSSAWQ